MIFLQKVMFFFFYNKQVQTDLPAKKKIPSPTGLSNFPYHIHWDFEKTFYMKVVKHTSKNLHKFSLDFSTPPQEVTIFFGKLVPCCHVCRKVSGYPIFLIFFYKLLKRIWKYLQNKNYSWHFEEPTEIFTHFFDIPRKRYEFYKFQTAMPLTPYLQ